MLTQFTSLQQTRPRAGEEQETRGARGECAVSFAPRAGPASPRGRLEEISRPKKSVTAALGPKGTLSPVFDPQITAGAPRVDPERAWRQTVCSRSPGNMQSILWSFPWLKYRKCRLLPEQASLGRVPFCRPCCQVGRPLSPPTPGVPRGALPCQHTQVLGLCPHEPGPAGPQVS